MKLEDLVISPTPEQRQLISLHQRLGRLQTALSDARVGRQAAERLAARRSGRISELEGELLEKRREAGGLRLAIRDIAPELFPRIDAHIAATAATDLAFGDDQPSQGGDR